jgi:hypothetical protein
MKLLVKTTVALIFLCATTAFAQPRFSSTASEAELKSADLKNFVDALDRLNPAGDAEAILKEFYFDKASPGLKEYIRRFGLNPARLAKAIKADPSNYKKIKGFYDQLADFDKLYREDLRTYKAVYPKAMFAPTYLLVSANRGIGQASRVGQLVTVERVTDNFEKLRYLAVHEITHFQQAVSMGMQKYAGLYGQKDNMLGMILREGAAEFVTYRLIRKSESDFARLIYLNKRESELWERFERDLANQDKDFWLGISNQGKGQPILLGYAMGYKIVAAYYDRSTDKTQALHDIMAITEPESFYKKSNFKPQTNGTP